MEYGINLPKVGKNKLFVTVQNANRSIDLDNLATEYFGSLEHKKPKLYQAIDRQIIDFVKKTLDETNAATTLKTTGHFKGSPHYYGQEEIIPPIFYAVEVAVKQKDESRKSIAQQIVKLLLDFGADPNSEVCTITFCIN